MNMPIRDLAVGVFVAALACATGAAPAADEPRLRHAAPLEALSPGAWFELTLPVEALRLSARADHADVRIVDAQGQRTPFAWLPPQSPEPAAPRWKSAAHWAWPASNARNDGLPDTLEVISRGGTLVVRQRAGARPGGASARPAGWLVDLGKAEPGAVRPDALKLAWPPGAAFSVAYRLETSADLRQWQPAGGGTLLSLSASAPSGGAPTASINPAVPAGSTSASPAGAPSAGPPPAAATGATPAPLEQPLIPLPAGAARFVRWTWTDPAAAPALTQVQARLPAPAAAPAAHRARLVVPLTAEPAAATGDKGAAATGLLADLGGVLPVARVQLQFRSGTQISPVRVQWRERADAPWREAGSAVFYRVEQPGGSASESPALPLPGRARFLRLLPDPRSAAPAPEQVELAVDIDQPRLLWARQGTPPHRLLIGAATATAGDLPLATLVPGGDPARLAVGPSRLGAFTESPEAAQAEAQAERAARWRPALLWGVLVAGVLLMAGMVWRLAQHAPRRPKS